MYAAEVASVIFRLKIHSFFIHIFQGPLTRFKYNRTGKIDQNSGCSGEGAWETNNGISLSNQIITDYYSVRIGTFKSTEIDGTDVLILNKEGTGSTGFDWDIGRWYHDDVNRVRLLRITLAECYFAP